MIIHKCCIDICELRVYFIGHISGEFIVAAKVNTSGPPCNMSIISIHVKYTARLSVCVCVRASAQANVHLRTPKCSLFTMFGNHEKSYI